MAEWLGRGLQNLVQRFESASDLQKAEQMTFKSSVLFLWCMGEQGSPAPHKQTPPQRLLLCKNILKSFTHLGNCGCGDVIFIARSATSVFGLIAAFRFPTPSENRKLNSFPLSVFSLFCYLCELSAHMCTHAHTKSKLKITK